MSRRHAAALLRSLLEDAGIDEDKFYAVVDALYASDLINHSSIRLEETYASYELRAEYIGRETIGHAREGTRRIKKNVVYAAEKVYKEIFGNSGVALLHVFPSLDDNEANGKFKTSEHEARSLVVTLFY